MWLFQHIADALLGGPALRPSHSTHSFLTGTAPTSSHLGPAPPAVQVPAPPPLSRILPRPCSFLATWQGFEHTTLDQTGLFPALALSRASYNPPTFALPACSGLHFHLTHGLGRFHSFSTAFVCLLLDRSRASTVIQIHPLAPSGHGCDHCPTQPFEFASFLLRL